MPLGLNTIVIPAAYGKDTTAAAGMALISHTLAVISIPILFLLIA
jgi:predicted permease